MSGILLAHRHGGAKTGIALPAIGDAWLGGYFTGVIDTTKGNISGTDFYQTGQRFAVIIAPVSLENAALVYKTTNTASPAQARTVWNGLDATISMSSSTYPAAQWCYGRPFSSDGASRWYLPASDELELAWRNLKPYTSNNYTSSGLNQSSDPPGAMYTASVPAQTTVAAFKSGGAQAMTTALRYWTATELDAGNAWYQQFASTFGGSQDWTYKNSTQGVRPVRRLVLA